MSLPQAAMFEKWQGEVLLRLISRRNYEASPSRSIRQAHLGPAHSLTPAFISSSQYPAIAPTPSTVLPVWTGAERCFLTDEATSCAVSSWHVWLARGGKVTDRAD